MLDRLTRVRGSVVTDGIPYALTTFDRPARTPEDLVAGVRKALAAEIC